MKYQCDGQLKFSLELPEGWKFSRSVRSEEGDVIYFQGEHDSDVALQIGIIAGPNTQPDARERYLSRYGSYTRVADRTLGDESNSVCLEYANGEGILSAVRDGIQYSMEWRTAGNRDLLDSSVQQMLRSFSFPDKQEVQKMIARKSNHWL